MRALPFAASGNAFPNIGKTWIEFGSMWTNTSTPATRALWAEMSVSLSNIWNKARHHETTVCETKASERAAYLILCCHKAKRRKASEVREHRRHFWVTQRQLSVSDEVSHSAIHIKQRAHGINIFHCPMGFSTAWQIGPRWHQDRSWWRWFVLLL